MVGKKHGGMKYLGGKKYWIICSNITTVAMGVALGVATGVVKGVATSVTTGVARGVATGVKYIKMTGFSSSLRICF